MDLRQQRRRTGSPVQQQSLLPVMFLRPRGPDHRRWPVLDHPDLRYQAAEPVARRFHWDRSTQTRSGGIGTALSRATTRRSPHAPTSKTDYSSRPRQRGSMAVPRQLCWPTQRATRRRVPRRNWNWCPERGKPRLWRTSPGSDEVMIQVDIRPIIARYPMVGVFCTAAAERHVEVKLGAAARGGIATSAANLAGRTGGDRGD